MKFIVPVAAALMILAPGAFAQTAPAPAAPAAAPAAPAAKFNLDTPIEVIVADPQAKAVLDADIPGTTTHASYGMFKSMSLRAVQPFSQGKLTDEMLKKVETDLAAIK
ncbi:hypothetical protein [Sphingomonas sp. LM7]|uniref:hypothetical protein n=1 Tax=Sphingomonas sp. LM7 TaxID=1938607 RepID=UPI000983DB12|nr:hypothetical protein [Sphingomonas sp. LM7]AQR74897.1 hypothetical protein BXU08_15625 [Sphingomonas sp. LM7]